MKLEQLLFAGLCLFPFQRSVAQTETKKNLLFIMTDQQRYDALSHAGNSGIQTPNLDKLAKMGAYFQNAYAPCAVCGPSRSSILTGSTIENTGVHTNGETYYNTDESIMAMPTFDEVLSENGYHCEYYGKWHSVSSHAEVYKNPVKLATNGNSIFGPGGQSHIWRDELDKLGPPPDPQEGQFIDLMSKWPYIANPLDRYYGLTYEQMISQGSKHSQPDQHGELLLDTGYTMTAFQAKQTIEALERLKDSTFSITCSFHFPHSPMLIPEPYYGMYPVDQMVPPVSISDNMYNSPYINSNGRQNLPEYADPDKVKYMISEYYGIITEIDVWVGRILDKLNELGIADNTMIIFASDHGEMLGAHGMREKNIFLEESAHIPLAISLPGEIPAETQVDGYTSLIDLFPTILDYLGVPEHPSDGTSLRGLIEGTNPEQGDYVVTEWNSRGDVDPNYMIVKDGYKLMIPFTISSQVINAMYDLNTDPHEMTNLLGSNPNINQYIDKAEELRAKLVEWLEERNSIHTYSVSKRDLLNGGKPTGNNASFVSQEVPDFIAGDTITVSITMKNTGTTAWIPEGLFRLGSQAPADNEKWGVSRIELSPGDSIVPDAEKIFTFDIVVPENEGIHNFQWQMIQEGEEWFGYKSDMKQIIIGDPGAYWDDCDDLSDWKSSSALIMNTTDQQQGNGCIEYSAAGTDEFKKTFSTPYNSRGSEASTVLKFWYYVSDVTLFESANQVEIGSAGKPDQDEYNWSLTNLTNGWNFIELNVSEAGKLGSPDLNAINWFRIYHKKTGVITTRIDAIQLVDPNADPIYTLLVNGGIGGGNYFENEEITITANQAPEGKLFDKWVVDQGNATIADTTAETTIVTMGTETSVISAVYRETKKYALTVNNGSASGSYSAGISILIQADNAPEGQAFDKWVINLGDVTISESSPLIYLTMPEEDVEITATYKDIATAFDKYKNINTIEVYPNPAKNYINVKVDINKPAMTEASIVDLSGRAFDVKNTNKSLLTNSQTIKIPLNNLTPGTYFLKISIDNDEFTKRIVID